MPKNKQGGFEDFKSLISLPVRVKFDLKKGYQVTGGLYVHVFVCLYPHVAPLVVSFETILGDISQFSTDFFSDLTALVKS